MFLSLDAGSNPDSVFLFYDFFKILFKKLMDMCFLLHHTSQHVLDIN